MSDEPAPATPPTPPAAAGLDAKEIPDDEIVIAVAPDVAAPGLKVPPEHRPPWKPTPAAAPAPKIPIPDKDHAALALIDIAIDQSFEYCKKEGLPEPNTALWENFSRPFMNRALWHYCPDDIPDSPVLCLILGSAGIGIMYIPIIMALMEKQEGGEKKKSAKKAAATKPAKKPLPTLEEKEIPANVQTWTEAPEEEPAADLEIEEEERPAPAIYLSPEIAARIAEAKTAPTGF